MTLLHQNTLKQVTSVLHTVTFLIISFQPEDEDNFYLFALTLSCTD